MNSGSILVILLLAGLVAFAGCTGSPGSPPPVTVLTPDTVTPVKTTTPVTFLPSTEIARITVDHFGMNLQQNTFTSSWEQSRSIQVRIGRCG